MELRRAITYSLPQMVRRAALSALLLALAPAAVHAQTPRNLDLERFRPSPDRYGFLGIPGTRTPGPNMWNLSLWAGYSLAPLSLERSDGSRIPIVGHRAAGELIAELGITDRAALVVSAPAIVWQETNPAPLGARQLSASALRDLYVSARVRVLGEGATGDHRGEDGAGLALHAAATIPIGLERSFAGEGAPQLVGAILADFHFFAFGIGAILGYRHRFAEPSLLGVRFGNELFFGVALESPLFFIPRTSAIFEARVESALDDGLFIGGSTSLEGDVGLRWAEGDFALTGLLGAGLTGGIGAPALRAMVGLEWAPRSAGEDGDDREPPSRSEREARPRGNADCGDVLETRASPATRVSGDEDPSAELRRRCEPDADPGARDTGFVISWNHYALSVGLTGLGGG